MISPVQKLELKSIYKVADKGTRMMSHSFTKPIQIIVVLALSCLPVSYSFAINKCVDAQGKVSYQNKACDTNQTAKTMDIKQSKNKPDKEANKDMELRILGRWKSPDGGTLTFGSDNSMTVYHPTKMRQEKYGVWEMVGSGLIKVSVSGQSESHTVPINVVGKDTLYFDGDTFTRRKR